MFFRKSKDEEIEKFVPKKKEEPEEEWDKKRVIGSLLILTIGIFLALQIKQNFLDKNKEVLGESAVNKSIEAEKPNVKAPINVSSEVDAKMEEIKKNIGNLNADDVASSSPQIQKVLNDIQGIKDLPSNQARQMCLNICSGI